MDPLVSQRDNLARRWGPVVLGALALVLAARAMWLAGQTAESSSVPASNTASHRPPPTLPARAPAPERLTEQQYAAIAGLCPTSLAELPPEILPPSALRAKPPVTARGRLTGVRIASREPNRGLAGASRRLAQADTTGPDGWLVSPEQWFSPEDRAQAAPKAPEPSPAEPASEPTAPPALGEPWGDSSQEPEANTAPYQAPVTPEPSPEPPRPSESLLGSASLGELIDQFGEGEDRVGAEGLAELAPRAAEETPPASAPVFSPPGVAAPMGNSAMERFAEPTAPAFPAPSTPRLEEERSWQGEYDSVAPGTSVETPAEEPTIKAVAPATIPAPQPETIAPPITKPTVTQPPRATVFSPPKATKPTATDPKPTAHPGGGAQAAAAAREAAGGKSADESHRELFAKNCYPSAQDCATCHTAIYEEWRVSSHAYAFVSPMFHRFEQTISKLSQGTVGHFCQRCHSPVATAMYEPRSMPYDQMIPAAQEGVTCIVCHRVNQRWGKSNGDRRIVPGDIHAPVYGGVGGHGVAQAIADKKTYKVKTSPHEKGPGQAIHTEGRFFDQLTQAEACTSCHQVAVHPGIKLEVVWEQYRASPACKKGVTCQECHMGRIPGMAGGYNHGPIAEMNGKTVNNHRKRSSHIFYGPGYSIAHPGVFPQHKDAADWTLAEWMQFDWRGGWGTDEFEERIEEHEDRGVDTAAWFPKAWADPDDRYDARDVVEDNLERLKTKRRYRELVMENGSHVDGPFFRKPPRAGHALKFDYVVANKNEGHNLPTASLGAQPQLWANVVLIGPNGRRLWESGYTDSNGDLCDIHSVDVREGRAPFDKQLFNLQTMFLITGAAGTDREFYLPVNFSFDQVPHLRPGTTPYTVSNHPPFIRMESRSLAPLGKKRVKYTVPAELMRRPGRYRLSFRLRSRTEPMYFMRLCQSTPEMLRSMVEGTLDIHPQSVEFEVR